MKMKELNNKQEQELRKTLARLREELRVKRFQVESGDLKTVRDIRETKKTIARILTRLKQLSKHPKGHTHPKGRKK